MSFLCDFRVEAPLLQAAKRSGHGTLSVTTYSFKLNTRYPLREEALIPQRGSKVLPAVSISAGRYSPTTAVTCDM